MRTHRHSRTAEAAAAIRASHLLYDSPPIFSDPYAVELTSPLWRAVCRNRMLHRLVVRGLLAGLRPVHGWILVRDQVTHERLREFVAAGARQYVLLGAGFDSIALRRPPWLARTRIFEVDHPATQAVKLARMRAITGHEDFGEFEAVAVDFERERLADGLAKSSYDPARAAFFAWQGVVYYLSDAAIRDTLSAVAGLAAPGSELVFDFLVPERMHGNGSVRALSLARRLTAHMGETYVSYHTPEAIAALLAGSGFELVELASDQDLGRRYCAGRADDLSVMRGFGIAHARRAE